MEKRIRKYIENLFRTFEKKESTIDIQEEMISNLIEKVNDLIDSGLSEDEAFDKAVGNLGTKSEISKIFNFKSITEFEIDYRLTFLDTLIAGVIYIALGFIFDYWHPGWVIFLVALAARNFKFKDEKTYILPIITVIYIFIGFMWDYWHPGWIVFPIGFIAFSLIDRKFGALWLMTIAIYMALGIFFDAWGLGSIVFLLAAALSAGRNEIIGGLWISVFAGYLFMGLAFDLWHPGWVIFGVTIALTVIIKEKNIVGFTWISSITVFLFLGTEYNLWHPAWVIFIVAAAISAFLGEGNNTIEVKRKKDELNNNLSEEDDL